jgi:hypothetical protein
LQNDFLGDVEMFNPSLIFILSHEEIGIPSGVSSQLPTSFVINKSTLQENQK